MTKHPTRLLIILFNIIILLAVWVNQAQAHAGLARSDPADNSILPTAPDLVRLWFTEAISAKFSTARVLDINGNDIQPVTAERDPVDHTLLLIHLPPLKDSVYSVNWQVASEVDGHFTQGLFVFGVGSNADLTSITRSSSESNIPLIEVALRWINYSLLIAVGGAVAILLIVLRTSNIPATLLPIQKQARLRIISWARLAVILDLFVWFGFFALQVAKVKNTLPPDTTTLFAAEQLLIGDRWGTLWLIRQCCLLALIVVLWAWRAHEAEQVQLPEEPRASLSPLVVVSLLLVMGVIISQALIAHAAALTSNTALAVISDVVHLSAASAWIGGLLALLVGVLPLALRNRENFSLIMQSAYGSFGVMAAICVGLITASGLYNTAQEASTLDALISTRYGQILLVKVGLMLLVGLVGFVNSMLLHPTVSSPLARLLRKPSGWTPLSLQHLPRLVIVESSLGLMVILAAGALTSLAPVRGPEYDTEPVQAYESLNQIVDDLIINFSVKPNLPGQNIFNIDAVSMRRPPPGDVLRVIVRFTYLTQNLGTTSTDAQEIEPDKYRFGGSFLSLPGPWLVEVVVRRKGLQDTTAQFNWIVSPPGAGRPLIISKEPISPILTVTSGVMLVLVIVIPLALGVFSQSSRKRKSLA